MKLYRKDIKNFDDGSIKSVYSFESIKTLEELKNFLQLVENQYGNLRDIIVKNDIENSKIVFYKRYQDLKEFCSKYNPQNFNDYNIYEFLGKNFHFKIDIFKNLINIYQKNDKLDEELLNDYKYYLFENGLIVRYNNINGSCDYLSDENIWIHKNSLITLIEDPAYKYEEIEDPLEEKKK